MFDFGLGTAELLLIAMVALIVVGPKELPGLLRAFGRWMGKLKALASEFQSQMDGLARESGVGDVKKEVEESLEKISVEDLDREFAEMESELRAQLATDGGKGRARQAEDEDLLEEEERPLPDTLDLDAGSQASAGADDAAAVAARRDGGKKGAGDDAVHDDAQDSPPSSRPPEKVAARD